VLVACFPTAFGRIHRFVGVRQQAVDRLPIRRIEGDADAGRHHDVAVAGLQWTLEAPQDRFRNRSRGGTVLDAGNEKGELVAAEPRQHAVEPRRCRGSYGRMQRVDRAHETVESCREISQQVVRNLVTERLVDAFEIVEIDEQDREFL
jgi:hypothetical protein